MGVTIMGQGLIRLWRGYNVKIFREDDGFQWEPEIAMLENWLDEHTNLPPMERIEIHDTCVLLVLHTQVVFLERTSAGLVHKYL